MTDAGDAFTRWMSRAAPWPRDAEADATAADYLGQLQYDCTANALTRFCCGNSYIDFLSRVVLACNAEAEAEKLRQPGRVVAIERMVERGYEQPRARVVVSLRRPNLHELCKANRLHRQALVGNLEGICRHARPGAVLREPGAVLRNLDKWRRIIREALMFGYVRDEAVEAVDAPAAGEHRDGGQAAPAHEELAEGAP
jgi:hypothetical protein